MRFFRFRFTAQRNGSITGSKVFDRFQTCFSGTVFDHLVEIPVVAGSWSPGHTQGTQVQVLERAKKQRANLKSLRCNSLFEARRHSFLGIPGTKVERFLRGVSPPGLPLLNWQGSYEALNDAEREMRRRETICLRGKGLGCISARPSKWPKR